MDTNKKNKTLPDDQENYNELSESELKIYEILYDALEKAPENGFSLGFQNQIIRKIEVKQQRKFNIKVYALFSIILLMAVVFLTTFFNQDQFSMMFSMFLEYKFIAAFLLLTVILIQLSSRFMIFKELKD
ncbi:hypothetical protein SAMN05421664_3151 [Chryseobacterium soldanellicola]|uniref:Uncharacterized protein n=1 Tax=Chryseobacterium soldanellicola TaxID=311333 RepID=A0A1H1FMR3_9FLAO|nr:hypothetical protein [Chryseobacterium soldanellicola]SDR02211.1 hypothetical protein SAMN05421664_3151 [Chryseobacterium soldanellicola]